MEKKSLKHFSRFALKVIIVHTLTYFFFGLIMSNIFHYDELFRMEIISDFMRPMASSGAVGIFLQPVRGLLFALALWPIRSLILEKRFGWLIVWNILVMVGILSTPAAAPCSVEGVIYSRLPLWYHLIGLPEILLQTLVFSLLLVRWDRGSFQPAQDSTPNFSQSPGQITGQYPERKNREASLFARLMRPLSLGCFAYIGYAVGAILFVFISGAEVDMEAAGGDVKMQLMFAVAFVVNVAVIHPVSRAWKRGKMGPVLIFPLFWLIDAAVPFLYQLLVFGGSSLPVTLALGFLPALIITAGIRLIYGPS